MHQPALFDQPLPARRARATGPHQEAVDGFDRLWREARGVPFVWSSRQTQHVKSALKHAGGDLQVFLDRAFQLLFDPPTPWYAQEASPALLASHWNQLGVRVLASRDQRNAAALHRAALEL